MPFIGNKPAQVPLTSADITDGIIVNADINASAAIALTKLASTGTLTVDNIQFPATQVASANANNLDDYEEGTWTPSIGGNATYSGSRYGRYVKIGKQVSIQFLIEITLLGTGSNNTMSGLPFTVEDTGSGTVQTGNVSYFSNLAVNTIFIAFYVENNATTIKFVGKATSGATVDNAIALFGNSAAIYGAVTYFTT
jgi:hypothetical protein